MELRDFIVTPLLMIITFVVAYVIRPYVTDQINRKYFIPALTLRIIGALAVGFLYQFYYGGGDTFNFHTHGSRHIWEAFIDSPGKGLQIFFYGPENTLGVHEYASKIPFLNDESSFSVIRLAFLFDLLTFSTYSATALLFAIASFAGAWSLFGAFYERYPMLHKQLALACLFVPSVFFWGSGILKDTITLACLGFAIASCEKIFFKRKYSPVTVLILLFSLYIIYKVKIYILLVLVPCLILRYSLDSLRNIRMTMAKVLLVPLVLAIALPLAYWAMIKASEDNVKYNLNNLALTARITAYDIRYFTGKDAGSGYSVGELDGTVGGMLTLAPAAINVSLYRPYLWEVKNLLMLLSALESFTLLALTVYVISTARLRIFDHLFNSTIFFCLSFSLTFAFAVGISTFNFGTLTRYKIPLLPIYLIALILLHYHANRDKKVSLLETTE